MAIVEIAPLAAAALARAIVSDPDLRPVVSDALEDVGLDEGWLTKIGRRYQCAWEDHASAEYSLDPAVPEFAMLISWVLARVRGRSVGAPAELIAEVQSEIATQYLDRYPVSLVPPCERVGLYMWVVGQPACAHDQLFPALLPTEDLDEDVAAAYEGLVAHAQAIPESGPFIEMSLTAVIWRFGGLINGLGGKDLRAQAKELSIGLRSAISTHEYNQMTSDTWLQNFVNDRNALTHVAPSSNGQSFKSVSDRMDFGSLDEVRDYLRAATYFAADQISKKLSLVSPDEAMRWVPAVEADRSWLD